MSFRNFRSYAPILIFSASILAYGATNAQESGPGTTPYKQNPTGLNLNDGDIAKRFEAFRLEAEKLARSHDAVVPMALQKRFVDVIDTTGLGANDGSDFFVAPYSKAIRENDDVVAKLAETAKLRIKANAWENSSMQRIYGRLLHDYDSKITPGLAISQDRQFFERAQSLLKTMPGYVEHVVNDDSQHGAGYFTQPNYPGKPIFVGGGAGEAFPRRLPYIVDKTGLLPGVGVVVQRDQLKPTASGWTLATTSVALPFGGVRYLPCQDEQSFMYRYRASPRLEGRVCTAFLLGSNTRLVTARHCLHSKDQAIPSDAEDNPSLINVKTEQYAVVFGFQARDSLESPARTDFPAQNVYFFKQANTSDLVANSDLIELDLEKKVPPDVAVPFETDDRKLDMSLALLKLTVAGYPVGMPLSIDAEESHITTIGKFGQFFVGGDNYHGDSGAPVFDSSTGKVIGLMVGGLSDFKLDLNKTPVCYVANRTADPKDSQEAALHLKSFLAP
ncbi:trypsin-like serine protease [Mesorhizobium sp. M2A.F.Ca.ET.042.01.1.1]|uniref:trypsin-like serine peptidase n=1 Tax=Mesorhizobium sp. M2A.F.Ca.ET.042.01.1.1 TaxID=2496745 RepID=UPI000FCA0A2D|nr:trypsin-like peptidase domain-containing protein [Mesorhizobium sp. M2A.F.Ca.ET.042.01.1.1]RUX34642.1 trypsin-like serine protease [Mesorhizobium sp. M2A.F.Ca.ET.042.01.1.1]